MSEGETRTLEVSCAGFQINKTDSEAVEDAHRRGLASETLECRRRLMLGMMTFAWAVLTTMMATSIWRLLALGSMRMMMRARPAGSHVCVAMRVLMAPPRCLAATCRPAL